MSIRAGDFAVGPDNGQIRFRTTRAGVAAKVGHDLTLTFRRWSGRVSVPDGEPTSATVSVDIALDSVEVVEGHGGVTPLTADDRHNIERAAVKLLVVGGQSTGSFRSTRVTAQDDESGSISGDLTVCGRTVPVTLATSRAVDGRWTASTSVNQTAFGITPYKALFGALRLADAVTIEASLDLQLGGLSTPADGIAHA